MGRFAGDDLLLMAFANYKTKNYQQMLTYTQQVIKISPDYSLALHYKALALLGIGDLKGAEAAVTEAVAKKSDDFFNYFVLGLVYWQTGDHKKAEDNIKKAITYTPNEASYLVEYATFLIHRGRFEEALDAAYKAKSIDDGAEKLKDVIKAARHKEFNEDIDALTYEPPLPYNARTAIPYNKLGDYYLKNSFVSNAQQQFSRALHFDPINDEAMQGFATTARLLEGGFYYFANTFARFILQWYILFSVFCMFILLGFVAFQEPFFRLPALGIALGVIAAMIVFSVVGLKPKTAADYRKILAEWEVDNIDDLMRKMHKEETTKSAKSLEEEALQNEAKSVGNLSNFFSILAAVTLFAQMLAVNIKENPLDPNFIETMLAVKNVLLFVIVVTMCLAIFFRIRSILLNNKIRAQQELARQTSQRQ